MLLLRQFFTFKLILDCHNAALFPLEGKSKWLNNRAHFLIKKADLSIVTNNELAEVVKSIGGVPIILNDPIPNFDYKKHPSNNTPQVTLISTWADDEPVAEFISVASSFQYVNFVITGKPRAELVKEAPKNIKLPGFVSRSDYINLIANSELIVDLTYRDNCLVCGAYEAIAVEVPLLLSNTNSLKTTFDHGAVFCVNTKEGIKQGLEEALSRLIILNDEIITMKTLHTKRWSEAAKNLKVELK